MLYLLFWLFTKHFIVDFLLQTKYQWSNKGKYGHPGGLLHAGLHGMGTALVAAFFGPFLAVALMDAVVHYHVDWAKVNVNAKMGWGPTTSEKFWWLLGADQYVHTLTYVLIAWMTLG